MSTIIGGLIVLGMFNYLLKRTFIGKSMILCFKIVGSASRLTYFSLLRIFKAIDKKTQKLAYKQKDTTRRTQTSSNVIGLSEYKKALR